MNRFLLQNQLFSGSVDGTIRGWDLRRAQLPFCELRGHEYAVRKIRVRVYNICRLIIAFSLYVLLKVLFVNCLGYTWQVCMTSWPSYDQIINVLTACGWPVESCSKSQLAAGENSKYMSFTLLLLILYFKVT